MVSDNRHWISEVLIIVLLLRNKAHKRTLPDNAEARPTAKEVQVFVACWRRVPSGILLPLPAALKVMVACIQKLGHVKYSCTRHCKHHKQRNKEGTPDFLLFKYVCVNTFFSAYKMHP